MNNPPSELFSAGPSSIVNGLLVPSSSVELKKDGSASKMRMHKGNLPSIPQNKLCPICPAKFTRTTHLNRHLRTHSGQRLHECDICHSQFTRSDLLTRHKRTCGDPESVPRSRRKSCQGCAESKVKCDLQQPCSKCKSRNRDCIYISGHSAATGTQSSHSRAATASSAPKQSNTSSVSEPSSSTTPFRSSPEYVDAFPSGLEDKDGMNAALLEALHSNRLPMDFASPAPYATAQPVNFFVDSLSTFSRIDRPDAHVQSPQNSLFSNELFDDLLGGLFTPSQQQTASSSGLHSGNDFSSAAPPNNRVPYNVDFGLWHEVVDQQMAPTVPDPLETILGDRYKPMQVLPQPPQAFSVAEILLMRHYTVLTLLCLSVCLFFSTFLRMVPLVHTPTFQVAGKPPILLIAMRACGALYVRSRAASTFINAALDSVRDELFAQLAQDPKNWEDQIYLALAFALLQTIGLFHQLPERRVSSTVYHGMMIMLIRMNRYVQRCASWTAPDIIDAASADTTWRDWALHETAKRAILLSHSHDCCTCIYFNLRPTFSTGEFELGLPCEDALWLASSAEEWLAILQRPSPYGSTIAERLTGLSLQRTLAYFAESRQAPASPLILNPYAHFVVIHSIMRTLFEGFLDACPPEPDVLPRPMGKEELFGVQLQLQRWLQSWLASPDSPPADGSGEEPPFVSQSLPFYWLAQVAILAYQEGLPPFGPGAAALARGDIRFRLMKKWERHIRRSCARARSRHCSCTSSCGCASRSRRRS
ncbi:hypothetical protein B0H21DRAFT_689061 [Amylocystis lapponica]|nr:hypothetical protein B0H21DRAFT_689061 [Amylocystis lapponica]